MSSPIPVPPRGGTTQDNDPHTPFIESIDGEDSSGETATRAHDVLSTDTAASRPSLELSATPMLVSMSASPSEQSSGGNSSISVLTPPGGYLSDRRASHKLVLTPEEKSRFGEAIEYSKRDMQSDAKRLPKSTNMGLGARGPPAKVIGAAVSLHPPPPRREQPVAEHERAMVLTEHERTMRAYAAGAHSWEESETMDRPHRPLRAHDDEDDDGDVGTRSGRAGKSGPTSSAVFMRVIPSLFTSSVTNAITFYKDILGFSLLGKPDPSHAGLVRSPTTTAKAATGRVAGTPYLKVAPPDGLQIYLRIAPLNAQGERERPAPTTLWIEVNDVDAVYAEVQGKLARFAPRADEYFPMHSFGDARILAKPQNKAWGNREMHVVDGDDNKIIFFKPIN